MTQGHADNTQRQLTSWRTVQRREHEILSQLSADPALLLAAAANPLFALAEIGYQITGELSQEFTDRLRFGSDFPRISSLRKQIFELAGDTFDLDSAESLHAALTSLIGNRLTRPISVADTAPFYAFEPATGRQLEIKDPLQDIADDHPIVTLLLQYRQLNASVPPFANHQVYDEIRRGERTLPITSITISQAAAGA
jgi:hypothetical protein